MWREAWRCCRRTRPAALPALPHRQAGPDPKVQPLVDLVDLEGEEGTALRLRDDECLDVLCGLGRERKREGQAVPSKSQNLRDKRIQLVDPLLESSRVDGASEVDRFHGASSVRLLVR
jgi:hypothetical protein